MIADQKQSVIEIKHPINLGDRHFVNNKFAYYQWLRQEAPVYKGKMSLLNAYFVSRYEDCVSLLKDPRFVRHRTTATGGKDWISFLLPSSLKLMMSGMIFQDEPNHRRLRALVHKAFTPRALQKMHARIEALTHLLLNEAERHGTVDLKQVYALPIPVTVISELVGVGDEDTYAFQKGMSQLMQNMSGIRIIPMALWQMPRLVKLIRRLIAEKRKAPGQDILSGLIVAEEAGDRLSDDELVSMVLLLITAGYETTVHLIGNGTAVLLAHPEQLAKLQADWGLLETAVEEIMRYSGSVHGTEFNYAAEPVTWHGVTIPKGAIAIPLLGSANRDPSVFAEPDRFDITRSPNKHLGFGQGIHYCLGAPLARLETQIALKTLFGRYPNLRLAVPPEELIYSTTPAFHAYESLPVKLR